MVRRGESFTRVLSPKQSMNRERSIAAGSAWKSAIPLGSNSAAAPQPTISCFWIYRPPVLRAAADSLPFANSYVHCHFARIAGRRRDYGDAVSRHTLREGSDAVGPLLP